MITSLEIKNFKGLENVKYDKFGLVNAIYGKNESGKSTILDCICWLLCDSTLLYGATSSNDELVNINKPYELIEASLTITDTNNVEHKIERSYGHKLNEDETITDVNAYYVNDRRCRNQKDYFDYVDNYLGLNFKTKEKLNLKYALINPFVFGKEIKQEVFRRLIKEILDVDFEKIVFDSNPKYAKILNDFNYQGNDINNLTQYYKQMIKKENSIINEYGLKIDKELTSDLEKVKLEYSNLLSQKVNMATQSQFKASEELTNVLENIVKKNEEYRLSMSKDIEKSKPKVDDTLLKEIADLKNNINNDIEKHTPIINELNTLRNKVNTNEVILSSIQEQLLTFETAKVDELICPHCGKSIITQEQQNVLDNIKNKINELETRKDNIEKENENLKVRINEITPREKSLRELILLGKDTLRIKNEELESQRNKKVELTKSEETLNLEKEIAELNEKSLTLRTKEQEEYSKKQEENRVKINEIQLEINNYEFLMNKIITNENLKIEKKKHLTSKANYEALFTVAKDFANDLASVIKNNCNKIFGNDIDFVMVKKNKSNDDLKPVCYAQVNGIPYNSLNSANVLLTGIIVTEKIKEYINSKNIPVLFDVVDNIGDKTLNDILSKVSSQVFYTEVDRTDKTERTLKIIK